MCESKTITILIALGAMTFYFGMAKAVLELVQLGGF